MRDVFRKGFIALLFGISLLLCYWSYTNSHHFHGYALLYLLGLTYHVIFDKKKSLLFITVFSFFILSSVIGVYYYYTRLQGTKGMLLYVLTVQFPWLIGFIFIFIRLLRDNANSFKLGGKSLFVLLIISWDVFYALKMAQLIGSYNLGADHIFYAFSSNILKMILMSVGLIFYLTRRINSRKTAILFFSLFSFFLSDILDTMNTLFFYDEPVPGISVIRIGFSVSALVFFYMYCSTPKFLDELEVGGFI